jgi:hypothetical protein
MDHTQTPLEAGPRCATRWRSVGRGGITRIGPRAARAGTTRDQCRDMAVARWLACPVWACGRATPTAYAGRNHRAGHASPPHWRGMRRCRGPRGSPGSAGGPAPVQPQVRPLLYWSIPKSPQIHRFSSVLNSRMSVLAMTGGSTPGDAPSSLVGVENILNDQL